VDFLYVVQSGRGEQSYITLALLAPSLPFFNSFVLALTLSLSFSHSPELILRTVSFSLSVSLSLFSLSLSLTHLLNVSKN